MTEGIFFEAHQGLPRQNPGRDEYTEKAFRMLATSGNPRILDIGCGSGAPTLELARLSDGEIIGIDITQLLIDESVQKIEDAQLSHRVKVLNCSMFEMDFPDESFDIVWAEGSIYSIGFDRGLREWRRLVKPGGFVAVHEAVWLQPDPPEEIVQYFAKMYSGMRMVDENLAAIPDCGYEIVGHFTLPEDSWQAEYYGPLEKRLAELRRKYAGDTETLAALESEQEEIEMYRKYGRWYGSALFLMKKTEQ